MKILALVCRILLGLLFIAFGANGFHNFMHMPPPPVGTPTGDWMMQMIKSGWLPAVNALQILGGLLVLIGGTVPLGLCILCPITINILLFHMCMAGGHQIAPGAFSGMLEIVLIWAYRANFNGILTTKATPTVRA